MTDSASRPPAEDEIALLKAAQSGDQRAFGQLVEPYRRALTIHSYRMVGSPHDAEDIVQETLLRAWRKLGSYEPRAPANLEKEIVVFFTQQVPGVRISNHFI